MNIAFNPISLFPNKLIPISSDSKNLYANEALDIDDWE